MARRRRKSDTSKTYHHYQKRDVLTVAIDPASMLLRPLRPVPLGIESPRANLPDDFRTWSPEPRLRGPQTFSGSTPVIKTSRKATPYGFTDHFAAPQAVVRCVRRGQRKEVIHALGKAGKRGPKGRYRRNMWSNVKC